MSNGRRVFIKKITTITTASVVLPYINANDKKIDSKIFTKKNYKIGVCDWMILKRQKIGVFKLASEIGADGVEVDMGPLGNRPTFDNNLFDPVFRKQFLDEAKKYNIEICSIAMSGFYAQSFSTRETYDLMVRDCVNTMKLLNVNIAFLPLGVNDDLTKNPGLRPIIIERLKNIARMAEAADVIIGIETTLPALDEAKLIDEINSPSIKSYFNFSNALQNGRDLYREIEILGKDRICQIHCTDQDGYLLRDNPRLNMLKVKEVLYKINWKGWLIVERSRDASRPKDIIYNFGSNVAYLKEIFK